MKGWKASLDTAALGHYSRLCPTGGSLLKLIRQQKLIPVLGYPAEPPGFLEHTEAAGTPGRLVFALVVQPALGTSSPLLHLLLAFCWRLRVGRKGDLFRILQVLVPFESSPAHGCFLAEIHAPRYGFLNNQKARATERWHVIRLYRHIAVHCRTYYLFLSTQSLLIGTQLTPSGSALSPACPAMAPASETAAHCWLLGVAALAERRSVSSGVSQQCAMPSRDSHLKLISNSVT